MKFFYFLFSIAITVTTVHAATIITHTIKARETIPMLAKKYNTTKDDIERRNNLKPNKYVPRGVVLTIAMNTAPVKKETKVVRSVVTITKISPTKNLHTLDEIRKKRKSSETSLVSKRKPESAKRIVRQTVVKKKKQYTSKPVKSNKKLASTSKRQKKVFKPKKALPKRVTVNDIKFKSSRSSGNKDVNKIINLAKQKLGRRYVWGAVGKKGTFDCSGFTSYLYKKVGINIPRTSRNQAKYGKYVSRDNLQKGDLIFFDTSKKRKGYVNHVGIYLGNGKFIHASSAKKRVVVSSLSKFYAQRYIGARRPS